MPPLITQPDDVWAFEFPETDPNFITQKQITAGVTTHDNRESLGNKIVCIPNADPGFDWLFSYPIMKRSQPGAEQIHTWLFELVSLVCQQLLVQEKCSIDVGRRPTVCLWIALVVG